jgi:hypothetical protein
MSSALAVNDVVEIFAYTAFTVANAYTKSETDALVAAAPGMRLVAPTSVSVGSGSGSVNAVGTVSFSGASSVSLNGVFSSTYDNYRVQLDLTGSNPGSVNMRVRSGTTDVSSSTYHHSYSYSQLNAAAALTTITTNASTTAAWISDLSSSGTYSHSSFDLSSPFLARPTVATGSILTYQNSGASLYVIYFGSTNTNSTSYDGITFLPTSNTLTGTVSIYGYKD